MRNLFLSATVLLFFSASALAQSTDSKKAYISHGFIAAGASGWYTYGGTDEDHVRPFVTGMWNVIRSDYGSLGLSVSGIYATPYRDYRRKLRVSYQISSQQYTGDFSLNYVKNTKMINFWLGAGLNVNYLESQMRNVENDVNGRRSNYRQNFYNTVYGYHYQVGIEHMLTADGSWGVFALLRGQYTDRAEFNVNRRLVRFSDGIRKFVRREKRTMDLSNDIYTIGMSYHF